MGEDFERSRVTLRDVAKKVGVSTVAVSMALRNLGRISEVRKQQIQKVAREMGYRPEPMARALAQYRQNSRTTPIHSALGWINHWDDPKALRRLKEFDKYWTGAKATAELHGFHLEEFVFNQELTLQRLEQILLTRNVRGLLIPPQPAPIEWKNFPWDQFSIVRFGHSVVSPTAYKVTADQMGNTVLAMENMIRLGYRRIGFAGQRAGTRLFLPGYLMTQLNFPKKARLDPLLFDQEELRDQNKVSTGVSTWIRQSRPDAILTEIPVVPDIVKKMGMRIPEDIGLATLSILDGKIDAGINQNPELIGKAAAEVVIALINRGERGIPVHYRTTLVPGDWVDGSMLPSRSG